MFFFFEIVISQLGEESNLDGHVNEGDKELVVSFCSKGVLHLIELAF